MITKKQVKELNPGDWIPKFSFARFRNGALVPEGLMGYRPPKFKRKWDGKKYGIEMERGLSIVVPKKPKKYHKEL